ncbi:MAG TPA: tetratricopeptide repeat protein [Tepidisphaeraceae bacterium]|jgi:predicted O-linked N-acetylglucosamine transferase (SPINDLY family)
MPDPSALLQQAVGFHEKGNLAEAQRLYQQVLDLQPNHPDGLHLLGLLLNQLGERDGALALLNRAVDALPGFAPFRVNLGNVLGEAGDWRGAIEQYEHALRLDASLPEVHNNLANALVKLSRHREAIGAYRRALALRPDYAEAHANLASALSARGDHAEAEREARAALAASPGLPRFHLRLAQVLMKQPPRLHEARAAADAALELARAGRNPTIAADAHRTLGDILHRLHHTEDALQHYQRGIALVPASAEARCAAAGILQLQGFVADAIEMFREALRLQPENHRCHSNLLWTLHSDPRCGAKELLEEHQAWARQHVHFPRNRETPHTNSRDPGRRLRVGYVSGDFREHSTSRFYLPLLENHNKTQFETFCYSTIQKPDHVTARVKRAADSWREVHALADDDLADLICADGIDILIDLPGHTSGNRLFTFARKPAPVQVSWLGWLGTTGLPQMDYWIADTLTVPAGEERFFTERVQRLRPPFLCYGPSDDAPAVAESPCGRNNHITFGSFNNLGKLSAPLLSAWARILNAAPNSRLLLKAIVLEDEKTRAKVRDLLGQHNLPVDRVELVPPEAETSRHLAAYANIDIGLDTFPFNGATTTAEALYMGIPVVTLAGSSHVSRVGLSLLTSVGLGDLCARSIDDYISTAVALAKDRDRIQHLRRAIRPRMQASPLMDGKGFTTAMEDAYRQMWQTWCAQS